eukprot:gb/GECG01004911.1/.p1 GENE.gb/GECG01004911.1/~~gb/GECG01004911.1/.p1  ORF type:complete len:362 (+),score=41.38 gb/GECG01004911.1/:1-1086(+)
MSAADASPLKRQRGDSETEWETTTVRSAYSMSSTNHDNWHEKMLENFEYVPPATTMGTEQQGKNLTCHICGTHSEKKKSACFYTCRSRTCQKTRQGLDGVAVCGSEPCIRVMESTFGFKCPKCSSLCCCVKEGREWRHKHDPGVMCPCKNKRGFEDRRGTGPLRVTPNRAESGGAASASISSDEDSISNHRLSSVEEQARRLKERQDQMEHSMNDLADRVSTMEMTNSKVYEGRILERIQKFQQMERDSNWIHYPLQREQGLHRLRHIMSDTDLFVQEKALTRRDVAESNEEKIRRTREECCLFGNSPNAILQWAQSKCKVIEEAQNQTQLSGISEDLPDHSLEGSPIGQDDRQNSGFSID